MTELPQTVVSPMPGEIVAVEVLEGQAVKRGQKLLAVEAVRIEQNLSAPFDGLVAGFKVAIGLQIAEGVELPRGQT